MPNVVINIYLMDKKPNRAAEVSTETYNTKLEYLLRAFSQSCEQGFKIKVRFLDSTMLLSYNMGDLFNSSSKNVTDSVRLLNIQVFF